RLLELGLDLGLGKRALEHHVPALNVRLGYREARVLAQLAQLAHGELAGSTDVDRTQERDEGRHAQSVGREAYACARRRAVSPEPGYIALLARRARDLKCYVHGVAHGIGPGLCSRFSCRPVFVRAGVWH